MSVALSAVMPFVESIVRQRGSTGMHACEQFLLNDIVAILDSS